MNYIRSFDIRLEKDVYYAGESLSGHVVLENEENIKIRGIRAVLRGKAHAEWKIMKSGERRTVKDDQYLLDDKLVIWGKDKHEEDGNIPILPRGRHQFPFHFTLPQSALPCSFESKAGTIRYYIKVVIDIPYASPPQGLKYFTIIGPHIDCMEEKYLNPMVGQDKKTVCCLCCQRGPIGLRVTLERTAYVCGENIRLHAQVDNQCDQSASVKIRLIQYVEYFIDKGVLGVNKNLSYPVLEHKSPRIHPYSTGKYDSTLEQPIKLPVVPPTLIGVCRLVQIYYVLKVCLEQEKSGDDLLMDFPFTVATVPFRIPNSPTVLPVDYDFCSSHVEGGMYISPEFQVGQVYDGTFVGPAEEENILLYRPVYVRTAKLEKPSINSKSDSSPDKKEQTANDNKSSPSTSATQNHVSTEDSSKADRSRGDSPRSEVTEMRTLRSIYGGTYEKPKGPKEPNPETRIESKSGDSSRKAEMSEMKVPTRKSSGASPTIIKSPMDAAQDIREVKVDLHRESTTLSKFNSPRGAPIMSGSRITGARLSEAGLPSVHTSNTTENSPKSSRRSSAQIRDPSSGSRYVPASSRRKISAPVFITLTGGSQSLDSNDSNLNELHSTDSPRSLGGQKSRTDNSKPSPAEETPLI